MYAAMARTRQTREEAKQQTREALLVSALKLFAEKGIEGPSLDAISEGAGYTRGAFYVHFSSRDDLLSAVMERILAEYLETIVQTADAGGDLMRSVHQFLARMDQMNRGSGSPFLAVGPAHLQVLNAACRRSEAIRARFTTLLDEGVRRLTSVIEAGQGAGTVRTDLDAQQVAVLLVYTVFGVLSLQPSGFAHSPVPAAAELLRLLGTAPTK